MNLKRQMNANSQKTRLGNMYIASGCQLHTKASSLLGLLELLLKIDSK